jgi:DNA-binding response OmpR family regulator
MIWCRNLWPFTAERMSVLDARMLRMNGFTLYKKMRETDIKPKVCFISAFENFYEEFSRFPHLEVKCFLHKPITRRELVEQIKAQLDPRNTC